MLKTAQVLPRISVASGSYIVSKGKRAILQANLGTCVGVALYDRNANVGGLIHLLLAEPPAMGSPWQTEIYAETGLPLFIERLCSEGARKENLEACIAGGALIGPLSKQDLLLDIGGRTADVVARILREKGISIHKGEIGGFFSCCLSLNLQTWETSIDLFDVSTGSPEGADLKKLDIQEIDRIIQHLHPIPQVALKVIRMISEQNHDLGEIAQEIMQDQVMSAKVIGFCNSAFTGAKARVDSIERALLIVGDKWLLQMIVATVLEEFFLQTDMGYSLCKGGLFQHACAAAAIARNLAQFTEKVPPDLAYTAGLLHDIGKVVLDQYMHPVRPLFYRVVQADEVDLIKAESEIFGLTHPEVGTWLAEHWSIPETLRDAIQYHHQPEQATLMPELTHLVYFADLIASRFVVGQELEKPNTDALALRLGRIGLGPEQFPELIARIPSALQGAPWPSSYHS